MSKNALKAFIRETLVIIENDDLSWADDPENQGPRGGSFSYLVPSLNKDRTKSAILKKFALEDNGEPAVVVVAESDAQGKYLLRQYSKSPYSESTTAAKLNAKVLSGQSPIIAKISNREDGWSYDGNLMEDLLKLSRLTTQTASKLSVPHYIVDRASYGLKRPTIVSTESARDAILNFSCIDNMSAETSVKTIITKNPKSPEWALATACFYSYAQSGTQMIMSIIVGTAIGAATGGWAGAGTGFVASLVWPDLVLRLPVIIWAHAMGETRIRNANLAYCAIMLLFEGFNKFLQVKTIAKTGQFTAETSRLFLNWGEKILPFVSNGKMSQATYEVITAGIDDLVATTASWWANLALWIAEIAAAIGGAIGIETNTQEMSKQVYELLKNDVDIQAIEGSSRAKMIQELANRYPSY